MNPPVFLRVHGMLLVVSLVLLAASLVSVAQGRILLPGESGRAAGPVTVVLADGWELPDLEVTWYPDEGVLVAERQDGARRTWRPEDLAGLRDAGGRDVTAEVLPTWALERLGGTMPPSAPPASPGPPPLPAPPPQPEPAPRAWDGTRPIALASALADDQAPLDPRVIFGLELGYSAPHDQHFGGADGGVGFEGVLRAQIAGPIYLTGGYLYQTLKNSGGVYAAPCPEDAMDCWGVVQDLGDAKIYGPWMGLSLVSAAESPHPVRFYLEGGVGRFELEGLPVWGWETAYVGYRLGTGFLIPVGEHGALDLGVRALHMPTLDMGWDPEGSHTMLGLRAGISLLGF
jgi:hypothetical protein